MSFDIRRLVPLLATVAWLTDSRWPARAGAFLIAFGIWDIVYYIGLHALIGWPPGLGTMDLLFLIPPGPWWHQPVAHLLGRKDFDEVPACA